MFSKECDDLRNAVRCGQRFFDLGYFSNGPIEMQDRLIAFGTRQPHAVNHVITVDVHVGEFAHQFVQFISFI